MAFERMSFFLEAFSCSSFQAYTINVYKIDQRCEVIIFQDNDKNHCIAFATELFFEEILEKKNE